jgi:hypothetical protein
MACPSLTAWERRGPAAPAGAWRTQKISSHRLWDWEEKPWPGNAEEWDKIEQEGRRRFFLIPSYVYDKPARWAALSMGPIALRPWNSVIPSWNTRNLDRAHKICRKKNLQITYTDWEINNGSTQHTRALTNKREAVRGHDIETGTIAHSRSNSVPHVSSKSSRSAGFSRAGTQAFFGRRCKHNIAISYWLG